MGIFQENTIKVKDALKGKSRGQLGPLGLVLPLVLIFGMAVVAIIIMSTVAAKTYSSALPWTGINNATISADVNAATENAFETYNQATQNLPLLAIIAVAFVVLAAIARFMVFTGGASQGGAL